MAKENTKLKIMYTIHIIRTITRYCNISSTLNRSLNVCLIYHFEAWSSISNLDTISVFLMIYTCGFIQSTSQMSINLSLMWVSCLMLSTRQASADDRSNVTNFVKNVKIVEFCYHILNQYEKHIKINKYNYKYFRKKTNILLGKSNACV